MLLITMKRGDDVAGVDKDEKATYENFLAHGWVEVSDKDDSDNGDAEGANTASASEEQPEKQAAPRGRRAR